MLKPTAPKKVLCIHDLSGVGRCSLAVILPVLSVMGVQPVALPTVVLSTHTGGFGTPARMDGAAYGMAALEHYHDLGLDFACIYTGYLGGEEQIALAKKADVILVAPATANVIAKMAHGIADDMLTTTVLAAKCPKLVSPAMNTGMLENPITQDNIATLERYGFTVIPSESGMLACKDVGSGRLPKEDVLIEYILHAIARPKDLAGLRIAVTAGPTQEPLDPVRYLTNHSTGKMGYAVARAAAMRGADVTLIHGPTALPPVRFTEDVSITTAQDMYDAVTSRFDAMDILVMAAAVADYRPATVADDKIKKKDGDLSIPVERTADILGTIGPRKTRQFLCGFSMETRDMLENSSAKLTRMYLDMVVANNLKVAGAGFGVDTNVVTFITPDGARELPLMSKSDVADAILDEILKRRNG